MQKISWILAILSFFALPICIIPAYFCKQLLYGIIFGVVIFMIISYVAHQLSISTFFFGDPIPYYISLPGSILPFIIIYAIYYVIIFANHIIYAITGKKYLNKLILWLNFNMLYKNLAKSCAEVKNLKNPKSFTIVELDGYTLTMDCERLKNESTIDYIGFTDNFGDYWRSYDYKKTFIREKDNLTISVKKDE